MNAQIVERKLKLKEERNLLKCLRYLISFFKGLISTISRWKDKKLMTEYNFHLY
jgi:hypothetical protein